MHVSLSSVQQKSDFFVSVQRYGKLAMHEHSHRHAKVLNRHERTHLLRPCTQHFAQELEHALGPGVSDEDVTLQTLEMCTDMHMDIAY